MDTPFFISDIPRDAKLCSQHDFIFDCDMDLLLNEIQVVDPRWDLGDLDTGVPSAIADLFEIQDMQLSKDKGEALCSVSLFKPSGVIQKRKASVGKDWQTYLEGLQFWIEYYRQVLPNRKLRVYVGDDVWDELYSAKILEARDVDFIRMLDSSRNHGVGQLWRHLALDDYDYEYVYIEDIDGRGSVEDGKWVKLIDPVHYALRDTDDKLKKFVDVDYAHIGTGLTWTPNEFEDYRTGKISRSDELTFFVPIDIPEMDNDYALIQRLCRFNLSWSPWIVRGPRRLPCEIKRILCRYVNEGTHRILYHPRLNRWSTFREVFPNLCGIPLDEEWLFYASKLFRLKYYVLSDRLPLMKSILKRYGRDCLVRRMYKQILENGSYIQVFETGEDFSFDLLEG